MKKKLEVSQSKHELNFHNQWTSSQYEASDSTHIISQVVAAGSTPRGIAN